MTATMRRDVPYRYIDPDTGGLVLRLPSGTPRLSRAAILRTPLLSPPADVYELSRVNEYALLPSLGHDDVDQAPRRPLNSQGVIPSVPMTHCSVTSQGLRFALQRLFDREPRRHVNGLSLTRVAGALPIGQWSPRPGLNGRHVLFTNNCQVSFTHPLRLLLNHRDDRLVVDGDDAGPVRGFRLPECLAFVWSVNRSTQRGTDVLALVSQGRLPELSCCFQATGYRDVVLPGGLPGREVSACDLSEFTLTPSAAFGSDSLVIVDRPPGLGRLAGRPAVDGPDRWRRERLLT